MNRHIICVLVFLCLAGKNDCQQIHEAHPDNNKFCHQFNAHSPIGASEDHFHARSSIMLGFRSAYMSMQGMLENRETVSLESVHEDYMVSPETMNMHMQMFGLMYGVSDRLTLMIMGNYISNSMNLQMRNGNVFSTQSKGLGDTRFTVLYALRSTERQSLHLIAGILTPTGSITKTDATPMSENTLLAYPMQLGSGTIDPHIGINYLFTIAKLYITTQGKYTFRTGTNESSYSFGNILDLNAWIAYNYRKGASLSFRMNYKSESSVNTSQDNFNRMMPLFDPSNTGYKNLYSYLGLNFELFPNSLDNLELGIETGMPLIRDVNGIQMDQSFHALLGLRYTLGNKTCH